MPAIAGGPCGDGPAYGNRPSTNPRGAGARLWGFEDLLRLYEWCGDCGWDLQSILSICSSKWSSRWIACACWKASLASSAAKSKRSTANFIHPMRCAPYQGSAMHWRPSYWACCMRPNGLRVSINSVASAGCFRAPIHRAVPINPVKAITQSGNNRIKRALYLAADAARRIDPGLAEVYWRLMVSKGSSPQTSPVCSGNPPR